MEDIAATTSAGKSSLLSALSIVAIPKETPNLVLLHSDVDERRAFPDTR